MRVLVAVRSLRIGGMERVAVNLCDALAGEGHDMHLLSFKKAKESILPEDARVRVHRVDFDRKARLTVVGLLYDLFARAVLNVVVRKTAAYWRGVYTSYFFEQFVTKLERVHGKFDVILVRGQGTFEYLWRVQDPRMYLFLENIVPMTSGRPDFVRRAFYRNKNLVCVSNGVAETFRNAAEALRIEARSLHVVPNPIPIDRIRELANAPCPGIPKEPYIVNVARLVPQKNQQLLLRAYKLSGVREKLVIVGGGNDEARLRALTRELGLTERVIFTGMQKNPYPWMKHAKLFVLSSLYEGFGVVLAESLACGTPVVAVDCPGGIRDVLLDEQTHFLCEGTPEALAQMIVRGLERPPPVKEEWVQRLEARTVARQIVALAQPVDCRVGRARSS